VRGDSSGAMAAPAPTVRAVRREIALAPS